jgi:hypothetical protein
MEDEMPEMSSDMAGSSTSHDSAWTVDGQACLACSLVAIGAIGAVIGLMRSGRTPRRWPALTTPAPADFTPPHGDKLLARR